MYIASNSRHVLDFGTSYCFHAYSRITVSQNKTRLHTFDGNCRTFYTSAKILLNI